MHGTSADPPSAPSAGRGEPRHRPAVHGLEDGDVTVEVTRIDISATAIRRRVAAGLSIRYLVPRTVEEFIFGQKLYRRTGTSAAG
jgi:nicotinic acid mononucleotide adenylyltransferase